MFVINMFTPWSRCNSKKVDLEASPGKAWRDAVLRLFVSEFVTANLLRHYVGSLCSKSGFAKIGSWRGPLAKLTDGYSLQMPS